MLGIGLERKIIIYSKPYQINSVKTGKTRETEFSIGCFFHKAIFTKTNTFRLRLVKLKLTKLKIQLHN